MSRKSNHRQRIFYSVFIGSVLGPYLILLLFFVCFSEDHSFSELMYGTFMLYPSLLLATLPFFLLAKWMFKLYPALFNGVFARLIFTTLMLLVLPTLIVLGYLFFFEQINQQNFLTYIQLAIPVSMSVLVAVSLDFLVNRMFLRRKGSPQMK